MKRLLLTAALSIAAMAASAQTTANRSPFCMSREFLLAADAAVTAGNWAVLNDLIRAGACGFLRDGLAFEVIGGDGRFVHVRIYTDERARSVDVWVLPVAIGPAA